MALTSSTPTGPQPPYQREELGLAKHTRKGLPRRLRNQGVADSDTQPHIPFRKLRVQIHHVRQRGVT
eukprot:5898228-Pyramimonas_sp.AAC.1